MCIFRAAYCDGFLDGLLDLHAFAGNGLVQFPLEGQEVHVGLGLRNQVSDLSRRKNKYCYFQGSWADLLHEERH